MMPLFNEVHFRLLIARHETKSLFTSPQENMLYGNEPLTRKSQRTPSVRLRFGKRDPSLLENEVRKLKFHAE